MGVSKNAWFMENPKQEWMTGGTPISNHPKTGNASNMARLKSTAVIAVTLPPL